ncbi:MAG: ABC transporter permease subunit [Clostridia bacterium]|nr:ABC transporter permease subunit [Clostridia bacterium]
MRSTTAMRPSKARDALIFCLGVVLIGVLIQTAGALKDNTLVFPGVDVILRAFVRLLGQGHTWRRIGVTMGHVLLALGVSTVLGIGLGVLMGLSRFIRRLLQPLMSFLRALPMVMLVFIIMVLMDYHLVPVVASVLILVPMIAEAACEGCLRIDRELIDVYRMNSGFSLTVLWQVQLPLMAGYLRQAYVNAVGMAVKLAVSTEYMVQTKNSLGRAVTDSIYFSAYEDVYAYALIMILLVLVLSELPLALLRRMKK